MSDIDSIVIEIRRDGDVFERITFLPSDELRNDGVEIPLTDSNDSLFIVLKDKVIA